MSAFFFLLAAAVATVAFDLTATLHHAGDPALAQALAHLQIFGITGSAALAVAATALSCPVPFGTPACTKTDSSAAIIGFASAIWTAGVALRSFGLLGGGLLGVAHLTAPTGAGLELLAYLLALTCLLRFRKLICRENLWAWMLAGGTAVLGGVLVGDLVQACGVALPPNFSQRLLLLSTWGFVGPMMWSASAKWLPELMGLKPTKRKIYIAACVLDSIGLAGAMAGKIHFATVLLLHAAIFVPSSLKVFGKRISSGRQDFSYGPFVRTSYVWLRLSSPIAVWASVHDAAGLWSASRHLFLVGFVLTFVLSLALWAIPLTWGGTANQPMATTCLLLLNAGCLINVISQIFGFQGYGRWAWQTLPIGGSMELMAVCGAGLTLTLAAARQVPVLNSQFSESE